MTLNDCNTLLSWYQAHKRRLPWRMSQDPYRIWISETMLQQTTTTAVIPYYERFLAQFPTVQDLAAASIEQVYSLWSGLGYYSRARNLHKAAQTLATLPKFPTTHTELLNLPGIGPYTARAVSSIAFNEAVGVLDGNVIRVLSRKMNRKIMWWKPKERALLQKTVDEFVQNGESRHMNQALMELGSQICTPQTPHCQLCPWTQSCLAKKANTQKKLPLKKPRRSSEIWVWNVQLKKHGGKILMEKNQYAPFLKNAWILPGTVQQKQMKPTKFLFEHSITHHKIYVNISQKKHARSSRQQWVPLAKLSEYAPYSLIQKALEYAK